MAFINRKDDNILPSKKIIFTASQLRDYLKQVEQDIKFYELEMAEVVEVHLDENKSSFPKTSEGKPNYAYMGGILARFITSEHGKAVDYLEDCKPLNPNIMTYPLVGEIVYLTQLPGTIGNKSRFYFSPFNITGSPSQNLKPNISILNKRNPESVYKRYKSEDEHKVVVNTDSGDDFLTGYYHQPKSYPRLRPEEGDVIIEGRFGNTIRLGGDKEMEEEGITESSKITLHTGLREDFENKGGKVRPQKEEFIRDTSSTITIGTMNKQNISLAFTPQVDNFVKFPMSEIFINSNQIMLNTKGAGNIGLLSSGNISIGSLGQTVIESPANGAIKVGGDDASEPGVLGKELKKVLDILLKAEIQKNTATIGKNAAEIVVKTNAGDVPGAAKLSKDNIKLQELNTEMTEMIASGPYLSKVVRTK